MTVTRADEGKQFRSLHEAPEAFVILLPMYGMAARQG